MNRVYFLFRLIFSIIFVTSTLVFTQSNVWKNIGPEGGYIIDIKISKSDPHIAYVLVDGGDIFKSEDYGESWIKSGWHDEAKFLYLSYNNADILYTANYLPESRGLYRKIFGRS